MDNSKAVLLIENLLDRIEFDPKIEKNRLGILSAAEKTALEFALGVLRGSTISVQVEPIQKTPPVPVPVPVPEKVVAPAIKTEVTLNLDSLKRDSPDNPDVILCLDFGTAMSKAFAMQGDQNPIELALGTRAGSKGYPVDSSIFITDEGLLKFGPQAVAAGTSAAERGRKRFDSFKARLNQGTQDGIDRIEDDSNINPTTTIFSERDLITLYLAYLTDLAVAELKDQGFSRYTLRRFARPCWNVERRNWAEPLMREMLTQAQILADTFQAQWQSGISVMDAKNALSQLKKLPKVPEYLIAQGIPEPVAAAASLMVRDEAQREIFMVIDVGAGTTDFGMFLLQNNPDKEVCLTRIIPKTIDYFPAAGNRVDDLLKFFILYSEGIDPESAEGKHNKIYLDSRIRLYKESLFRDGIVEVMLANHSRVVVDREEFLKSKNVKSFEKQLNEKLKEVLDVLDDSYLDFLYKYGLTIVLTGGGASLPMVMDLAKDVVEIRGRKILKKPAALVPDWIEEKYPKLTPQYPQLAVAIGGASPDLPEEGESYSVFAGLAQQTYITQRTYY